MSRTGWSLVVLVLLLGAAATHAYYRLAWVGPVTQFESAEDHFLYGSIGTEAERGVPYWIWLVLPRIFPDHLPGPGGYASIGITGRDGHEMPIGLSKVDIGVPRVGANCALCHTATVRATPTSVPLVYPGAPAHQTGAQEYARFLADAAADPRFTASVILDEIARNVRLSVPDRLLYRFVLIPQTRRALLRRRADGAGGIRGAEGSVDGAGGAEGDVASVPWGRGRADMAGRTRTGLLGLAPGVPGTADAMPLWHLGRRDGSGYLWDRSNTSLREVVQASALVEGTSLRWMDIDARRWDREDAGPPSSLRRVLEYLDDLPPPAYPFPVDPMLAASGATTYAATCARCHEPGGAQAGTVMPRAEIGTDGRRLDAWTAEAAEAFNAFGEGHAWQASGFRAASAGYVAPSLDGVWLSAPYLHNGSVPTLRHLLEPPSGRPARFWRGYDVYDQDGVGFVSDGPDARRVGRLFDTAQPGNSNGGHAYGTMLSSDEKRALLEYLKTR
ncbi:MAG: c-type cytochrome [Vicinamibacterales bacterium]